MVPSTPIADAVAQMLSAGIPPETVVAFVRSQEIILGSSSQEGAEALRKLNKRRAWDRRRKSKNSDVNSAGTDSEIESSIGNSSQIHPNEDSKTLGHSTGNERKPTAAKSSPKLTDWPADYRERFWTLCPRKAEKQAAMRKLEALRTSGLPWATFLAGAERWAQESRGRELKYIKHPTTWLNRGCWDDESTRPQGPNGGPLHEIHRNGNQQAFGFAGLSAALRARGAGSQD